MRLGTPGFVGARLREAREARGISAPVLAQILGISRAAISHYERDQNTPGPDILARISLVLNQPPDFFLKQRPRRKHTIFFRSQAATTEAERTKADIRLDWLADLVGALSEYVQFPEVRFSPFDPPQDPLRLDDADIEETATATRRYWGLKDGPISNVVWLLENNGAIVTRGAIEERHMDSFCRFDADDTAPLIFLNADKSSAVRSRFDAAHELAHCVIHRAVPKEYWSNETKVKKREAQAHKFAAAFLLPRETFARDVVVPSLDTLLALKRKWRVSVGAMLMRLKDIELVSEDHAARLFRNKGSRWGNLHEPLDDELIPEEPRLLPKAIELIAQENPQAPLDLVRAIPLSPDDAASLAMVGVETFLEAPDPKLIRFQRRT